jgi:NAD-dependent protein deacetylase/lipoamidase
MSDAIETVRELLRAHREGFLLVVTGAGISLASGIPTFRGTDEDAIWSKDVTELGTHHFFRSDPAGSWRWYLKRFENLAGAAPNAGHRALVELERWQRARGEFLLVTQNIDALHSAAGSEELVEVHGRADRVRCGSEGCEFGAPQGWIPRAEIDQETFLADPKAETVPRCPSCGDFLRQHVLWFDETYQGHEHYQWSRVVNAAMRADLVLLVGTSCSVGVTELVLQRARINRSPVVLVDPGPLQRGPVKLKQVRVGAEEFLPDLVASLSAPDE